MSLSPMPHVGFKKCPCRPVDSRGQGQQGCGRWEGGGWLRGTKMGLGEAGRPIEINKIDREAVVVLFSGQVQAAL